jgi:hypothetical protein
MPTNEYHLILENFPAKPGSIPLRLSNKLGERILGLAVGVVRFNFEGRSDRPGKVPEWVKAATDVAWTALEHDGKTGLVLEAPQLGDVLSGRDYEGFFQEPTAAADIAHESAISLAIAAVQQATSGQSQIASGGLVDRGVLQQIKRFADIFPPGSNSASLLIHNESPTSNIVISRQVLRGISSRALVAPAPEPTRIAGLLEAMQYSAADARIIVGNRRVKLHIPVSMLQDLGHFFGHEVFVQGVANFNVDGQLTSIEVRDITSATGKQLALFNQVPRSSAILPSIESMRNEQGYNGNDAMRRRRIAQEIDIEESFEDLLQQLGDIS